MEILIDRNKKLSYLQSQFQQHFPALKIEFYSNFHADILHTTNYHLLNNELAVKEVTKQALPKVIKIYGQMTTQKLETVFAEIYGLSVQIFRKAGNNWIQANTTDNLALDAFHHSSIAMVETTKME